LNQLNNEHDDGNHEQKMDQTAAKVADKAQKPEHDQDDNYSPEHRCFLSVRLNFRRPIYPGFYSFAKIFQPLSRDSPAFGPTKSPVGTNVVPIVHPTRNVRDLVAE
jgi:hypothetical protein